MEDGMEYGGDYTDCCRVPVTTCSNCDAEYCAQCGTEDSCLVDPAGIFTWCAKCTAARADAHAKSEARHERGVW